MKATKQATNAIANVANTLAPAPAKPIVISNDALKATEKWAKHSKNDDKLKTTMLDKLYADGLRGDHLRVYYKDGRKDANGKKIPNPVFLREERNKLSEKLSMKFTAAERTLLAKDPKAVAASQKDLRNELVNKLGSLIKDVVNALDSREPKQVSAIDKAAADKKEEAAKADASLDAKLQQDLADWIVKLEKQPSTKFDLVKMLKTLKAAASLIK